MWATAEGTSVTPIVTAGRSSITMSRLRPIVAAAIALVLVLPATTLAATTDVGGTVSAGGAPAGGVEIAVLVQGTDEILSTTSDDNGAWTLQVDVEPGSVLEVNGTGQTTKSEPDAAGCVISSTPSGQVVVTVPAEGAVPAIDLDLGTILTAKDCTVVTPPDTGGNGGNGGNSGGNGGGNGGGTGNGGGGDTPAQQKPHNPGLTPPSTDSIVVGAPMRSDGSSMVLLGGLTALTGLVLLGTTRRRSARVAAATPRSRRR